MANPPTELAPAVGMRLDRRLLQQLSDHAPLAVWLLGLSLALALVITAAAWLLSQALDQAFLHTASRSELAGTMATVAGLALLRGILLYLRNTKANQLSARLRHQLRQRLSQKIVDLGPAYSHNRPSGELTATLVDGVEALDPYFKEYLPQLTTTALVPLIILTVVFPLDPLSGGVLLLTAPIIPFFMMLIGRSADHKLKSQWRSLQVMSGFFLERLQGLETLKILGSSASQLERIRQVSDGFRRSTLTVLRVAFLSALVLELAATLSTAIIAVQIGLRLLSAGIDFQVGFFILLLAPEYYLPMRRLGAHFHNSVSGLAAADGIFTILNTPTPAPRQQRVRADSTPATITIDFDQVGYCYPTRQQPALTGLTCRLEPGSMTAVVGPSGAGKSTMIRLLLRFMEPSEGSILVNGQPLTDVAPSLWRRWLAWAPQRPYIMAGSLEENIRLGAAQASREQVARAAQRAGLAAFIQSLPDGLASQVGERGLQLSSGQAQRLALARALLRPAPVLLLDEPTSDLDAASQALVLDTLQELRGDRTILWVSHRLQFTSEADQVLLLAGGSMVEVGTPRDLIASGGRYAQLVANSLAATP